MPDWMIVYRWLEANPAFRERYARARELGIDAIAQLAIDEATRGRLPEDVPAARLAFDARRWYVGKLAPKKYGDKVEVDTRATVAMGVVDVTPTISDEQRAAALRNLMLKLQFRREETGES